MAEEKPKTQGILKRAGITYADLGKALGKDGRHVQGAMLWYLSPQKAGKFVRTLAELTHLTTKERREIFRELVNPPGENAPLRERISTEDPFENLREADLGETSYKQAERDARKILGKNVREK